jgi:multiple sugar transport system permease protein
MTGPRFRTKVMPSVLTHAAAALVLIVMAFPLYGIILTSIQQERDIRSRDVTFVPQYIETGHYQAIFSPSSNVPVRKGMVNSLVVSLTSAVATVVIAVPATYALNRMRLPGARFILGGLVSIYLLPVLLFVIPLFVIWVRLGLFDSYLGLIIPYVGFSLPFVVWILGSFIRSIPVEVEEMARVDGATLPQLLLKIVLPLMRPGIFASLLLGFVFAWVEFLTPLLFTSDLTMLTVALGLFRSTIDIQIGQLAAATVITGLPVILVTILFQKQITEVVMAGAER